ncbi:hypothetical protein CYJ76_02680 [Kytococcus schroeteri]|uniref:Uncharacterized protein n=1 Tax=Kytococcus schroeteri TaxID=138300 RepID=A0A2I1PCZ5_9MICO|nr:hypothetical protein CYJ76_02680 [Kytococcus schroeteri]
MGAEEVSEKTLWEALSGLSMMLQSAFALVGARVAIMVAAMSVKSLLTVVSSLGWVDVELSLVWGGRGVKTLWVTVA